jgi:hypothetical protein
MCIHFLAGIGSSLDRRRSPPNGRRDIDFIASKFWDEPMSVTALLGGELESAADYKCKEPPDHDILGDAE